VPVEIGQTYVSEGWSQKIMPFKDFLNNHVTSNDRQQLGYLAQHNLFQQIPDLRQDFTIPDLCYVDTGFLHNEPLINAWFGPKNTVSPLHTDPHHNIFVQVIGYKYIRIYPDTASNMYAREQENGLDMSNTSSIDLEKEYDEIFRSRFKEFPSDGYVEAVVGPSDAVFIPKGHWHYVKSLSTSFSISFWI
jgi:lysine-specific demethylase 8